MVDPEIKDELRNLFRDELGPMFEQIDSRFSQIDARFESLEESIDSLARATAAGFRDVDRCFNGLQNQIDALIGSKADRSELAPIHAQLRNLQPR